VVVRAWNAVSTKQQSLSGSVIDWSAGPASVSPEALDRGTVDHLSRDPVGEAPCPSPLELVEALGFEFFAEFATWLEGLDEEEAASVFD